MSDRASRKAADDTDMGRSVIGLCALAGTTLGGFLPDLWGGSDISLTSVLTAGIGGIAGVFLGARLSQSY